MNRCLVLYLLSLAGVFFLAGCEDDGVGPAETGSLTITFDNRAGDQDLVLNTDYVNASGETFRLTRLNYYVSNIRLYTASGSEFIVPQDSSYFLILEDEPETHTVKINGVPVGDYSRMIFMVGVDSLRSTMDVSRRTGVLDPAQGHDGMYWTWNSGYIFFKMDGFSPAAPAEQEHRISYHIGGFGGYDSPALNNIREVTINLGDTRAEVRRDKTPSLEVHADVLQFYSSPNEFTIAEYPLVMFSEFSRKVSENYAQMFRYGHVEN